jgi:hypothetical protein
MISARGWSASISLIGDESLKTHRPLQLWLWLWLWLWLRDTDETPSPGGQTFPRMRFIGLSALGGFRALTRAA